MGEWEGLVGRSIWAADKKEGLMSGWWWCGVVCLNGVSTLNRMKC